MPTPYEPLDDSEFMDFVCPYCGSPVSFPSAEVGSIKECPTCLEALIVPQPGTSVGEKIPIPFETQKILFRRLVADDCQELTALHSSEAALKYLPQTVMSLEEVEEWLANDKNIRFPQKDRYVWFAAQHRQTSKLIGLCSFWYRADESNQAQFSIIMQPAFQRQGYGTEAVNGLLTFGFQGLRLHRIIAECDSRDIAGQALLKRASLRQEGLFIKDRMMKGEWVNTMTFAMLKEEFQPR